MGFDRDLDGSGLGAEIGIRSWLFPRLEIEANGTFLDPLRGDYDDPGGDTNDFTAGISARLHASPRLSLSGGWSCAFDAETETLSLGARYSW